jgi:hypothetical protein
MKRYNARLVMERTQTFPFLFSNSGLGRYTTAGAENVSLVSLFSEPGSDEKCGLFSMI